MEVKYIPCKVLDDSFDMNERACSLHVPMTEAQLSEQRIQRENFLRDIPLLDKLTETVKKIITVCLSLNNV